MVTMSSLRSTRGMVLVFGVGCGVVLHGQAGVTQTARPSAGVPSNVPGSTLPIVAPTSVGTPSSASRSVSSAPAQRSSRRAEVTFANGQLAVKADNSSLNQILREIGRQTGIKITGGVNEERVFGGYGPGSTAEVLNQLLDGTGSNVLLIASEGAAPGELILTPRQGGPTPPNPNAKGFDDDPDEDTDAPRQQQPRGVTLFGAAPLEAAPAQQAVPSAPPVTTAPITTDGSGAAPGTNPQSPNGVKTPQEIYQQLQQLRQQQQQQTDTPPR